jgi:hypothetical protein
MFLHSLRLNKMNFVTLLLLYFKGGKDLYSTGKSLTTIRPIEKST